MLKLLGKIYGLGADLRNTLYDRGVLRSHSLGARTISVGNITTGGTGKTPLVAHIAEVLAGAGEKVCILTRGYGRQDPRGRVLVSDGRDVLVDATTGGDEPVELARKLIGKAFVVADPNRVSAAAWAKEKFDVSVFVLDDGFQHRRAKRDLDIVCIDATDPFSGGRIIPAGNLREPIENLTRADAIVLMRSDLIDSAGDLLANISSLNPTAAMFRSCSKLQPVIALSEFLEPKHSGSTFDPNTTTRAFCGLGNPDGFFSSLRKNGYKVEALETFRDHHFYTQKNVENLEQKARERGISTLLTTGKDAVKLRGLNFSVACFVIEIKLEIENEDVFRRLVIS
jgi:tetraacyldisaccharide 4'-kinase